MRQYFKDNLIYHNLKNTTVEMNKHFPNDVEHSVEDHGNSAIFPSTPVLNIYHSNTSEKATIIVPRTGPDNPVYTWPYTHMPGISEKPFVNRRKEAEEIMSIFDEECVEIVPKFKEGQTRSVHNLADVVDIPPPVPIFWHFAPLTLRSTASANDVREKLFQILHDLGVNVEAVSSFWKYRLQKVCGDAYIDIQCHFFKQDLAEIAVDINLLSGDRFVWRYLAQNIRVMFAGGNAKGECYKPRDYPLSLQLEHGSMNDKRRAMRSLALYTSNVDISKIEPWLHKPTVSFLEKEIQRWAEYIKVNRAHL